MTFCRSLLFVTPLACLLAQTPPPAGLPKPPAPNQVAPKPAAPATAPAAAAPVGPPVPIPPDKVVLTIGDEKMTAGQLNGIIATLPEQVRAQANGPNRKAFIENIVRLKVLAQEAKRRKLDQDPAFLVQFALQRDNLLAGAAFNAIQQNSKITAEQVQQYYDQHKGDYESVKASHILIRFKGSQVPLRPGAKELTEEEALAKSQDLRKKIVAGADFATTAKSESDDTGSGAQGGELGTFTHGQMVPQFDEVAFKQPVGEVGEPFKTPFGYHIVKVTEHNTKKLDEVRDEIEKKMRPEAAMKVVESLQATTNVVIDPQYAAGQ